MTSLHDFIDVSDNPEPLCEELQARTYFGDGPLKGVQYINHPLYCSPLHFPALNRHANRCLKAKREHFNELIHNRQWITAIAGFVEKPFRVEYLLKFSGQIPELEYWPVLASVWMSVENLWQYSDAIRGLFRGRKTTIWETFENRTSEDVFRALPKRIEIFRGCKAHNIHGWSWTLSQEKARWFAARFRDTDSVTGDFACVRRAVIPKAQALCYFVGRGEEEIVVDPETIKDNGGSVRVDTL